MSSSHISNVDNIKIIRCIPIIMVPLDSLDYFFFSNLGKIVAKVYTTINCRFSKVVYFQARWIWLGCSRHTAFRHIYSKQNLSRPRRELIDFTSVFHGKTLCLCVLQFWDGFLNTGFRKWVSKLQEHWINLIHLRASPIHFTWKPTSLEKWQLIV